MPTSNAAELLIRISADPARAEANRENLVALKTLLGMPQTHVAVISGRALSDLASRTQDVVDLHLVGSHGSEFETGVAMPLPAEAIQLLESVRREVAVVAARDPGFLVEDKPASLAFHYRNANEAAAAAAVDTIVQGPATWPGVYVRHGNKVIELSVVQTNKGRALQRLR